MKFSILVLSTTALVLCAGALAFNKQQDAMPEPAKPGEQHKLLEKKVGTWETSMSVTGSPTPSKGAYTAKLDLGGLWLVGDFRGDFMGGPFSGHEVEGYDSTKKKYVATWVDSWMDHVMFMEGEYDAKTSTLSMWTEGKDMTGKPVKERHDTKFIDADNWTFTMNQPDGKGGYAPTMTITYKRKK